MVALPGPRGGLQIIRRAARPRLVDGRPRVDRPLSAATAGSTAGTIDSSRLRLGLGSEMAQPRARTREPRFVGTRSAFVASIDVAARMARRPPARWPSRHRDRRPCHSESPRHRTHGLTVERCAVQLQARRRVGASILHRCPCGGIVSCNGRFDTRPAEPEHLTCTIFVVAILLPAGEATKHRISRPLVVHGWPRLSNAVPLSCGPGRPHPASR